MKTDFGLLGRQSRVAFSLITSPVQRPQTSPSRAFTCTELLATVAAVLLLGVVTLPLLAGSKPRSERVLCLNNLRQIGVALNLWATDHGNLYQWRVSGSQGGNQGFAVAGNAWYQFMFVSNELVTPKVLVCPAEKNKNIATDWSTSQNGGYLNSEFRNKATSYLIGLDAFNDSPNQVLSGDRNVRFRGLGSCSTGLEGVPALQFYPSGSPSWTEKIHSSAGNLLFTDGRAVELSNSEFQEMVVVQNDGGFSHFLPPE